MATNKLDAEQCYVSFADLQRRATVLPESGGCGSRRFISLSAMRREGMVQAMFNDDAFIIPVDDKVVK